jgi:hypothetical protein
MANEHQLLARLIDPADPDGVFLTFAHAVAEKAEANAAVREAIEAMHAWLAVPIPHESLEEWARHRGHARLTEPLPSFQNRSMIPSGSGRTSRSV